jgi:hypothetical protein
MNRHLIALALAALFVPPAMAATKDVYPGGCVDCHVKEMRISTLLAKWNGKVDAKKLAAMQAFVPKGMTLKGKHPPIAAKDIPATCAKCHTATSKIAPPLPPLIHGAHLAKEPSEFVKQFQGECTHCHKLNKTTAVWMMPSGAEK